MHKKVWSVRHQGKVIAHTKLLHLKDAKFKVSEAGRQRVLREKQKNIHAGVHGTITEARKLPKHATRVSYNPYNAGHFYEADKPDKPAIHEAEHVQMAVHDASDPNGAPMRIPKVHAVTSFEPKLKKAKIDEVRHGKTGRWSAVSAENYRAHAKQVDRQTRHERWARFERPDGSQYSGGDPAHSPLAQPHDDLTSRVPEHSTPVLRERSKWRRIQAMRTNPAMGRSRADVEGVPAGSPELLDKAIADLPVGKMIEERSDRKVYDYSHLLTDDHRKAGYSLHVHEHAPAEHRSWEDEPPKAALSAVLYHKGSDIGRATTSIHSEQDDPYAPARKYIQPHSGIHEAHRGKKLGVAAYEALYAHSRNKLGIHTVQGGVHTNEAGRVHESLKRKHGLRYMPDKEPGIFDRGDYRYAIKSETFAKAQADKSGLMLAFFLPDSVAKQIALPGGESPRELHLTLAYVGKGLDEDAFEAACRAAREFAHKSGPLKASISGICRFTTTPDGVDPVVAIVNLAGIQEFHQAVSAHLMDEGLKVSDKFSYVPHVTLAYVDPKQPMPVQTAPEAEFALDVLTVASGERRKNFIMGGS